MMYIPDILDWSERITQAASDMLNRGQDREKIALRKCIDEWLEKFEPHYNAKIKMDRK